MSDVLIVAATVRKGLHGISKQAAALGLGLQNAAPGEKSDTPNHSVQYLLAVSDMLEKAADQYEKFFKATPPELKP